MPKAITKSVPVFFLVILSALISGCVDPETQKANELSAATRLADEGMYDQAMDVLNELAASYPNDLEVLLTMSKVYEAQGDKTASAFILQTAQQQAPGDQSLLLRTYQAQVAAGQPSVTYLEQIAIQSPENMTPKMWEALGAARAEANQPEAALDAYMKAVATDDFTPSPASCAQIGQLFLQLENETQAERWFSTAVESEDPSALQGHFGLLEIHLRKKHWPAAEAQVEQLETQFPGAIAASKWSDVPNELARWREAQDAMRAQIEADQAAAEAKSAVEAEVAASKEAEPAKAKEAELSQTVVVDASSQENTEAAAGKTEAVEELAAMEAMANATAEEVAEPGTESTTAVSDPVSYNPDVSVLPADPDVAFNVSFDQPETAAGVEQSSNGGTTSTEAVPLAEPANTLPEISDELSLEELLSAAALAEQQRDFKLAIHYYWKAVSKNNRRAATWDLLSQAYLIDGQLINAENASLEALRLDPGNLGYMLDYLRVIQRTKTPKDFLAILETAYDRFPRSPEIALSLARAYERIEKDKLAARSFYKRFIELAPDHALRAEAEAAIERLR
ncbi:tetratricopeptide repeat protein [Coraliomargarita akajimensis]|uniref:Tetratricopeptide repeat protein n=1 Tax=Coraliomargarita akajimensis (strain DSM 45221 / IAM 15411 / JCM 23193 / KCTC 12865 / 04OKA010-24) TaxID=583355 RepID=D5EJD5_CORAD|nr:tetratricopeptide repeat protein [Coraliomargarita akajimensis]ADE54534.1 hypothetical protein Caka_1515 [Coraliomargarita akajimensis DSM 45221]